MLERSISKVLNPKKPPSYEDFLGNSKLKKFNLITLEDRKLSWFLNAESEQPHWQLLQTAL